MWPLIAAGAGLGAIKYFAHDKPEAEKNQRIQIARELGSPWTGIHGAAVPSASILGDVQQAATTGAILGSNIDAAKAESDLNAAEAAALKKRYGLQDAVPENTGVSANRSPASMYGRVSKYSGNDTSGTDDLLNTLLMRRNSGGS